MRLQILVADNHQLVRQGMCSLLSKVPDFEVVGEAADGREAVRKISSLKPQVVLMDLLMPEMNGLDATTRALHENPNLKVIIVSMHAPSNYVIDALRSGAAGYLLKDIDADELERAIRAVARGERYLTHSVSELIIDKALHPNDPQTASAQQGLSPRQRRVLQLVAEGKSSREIAALLNLSIKTVETHRSHLMQRLDIYEVAGLTRYAIRTGLVEPER
jgi:DNA-binding NarL/FixJ family response regulator